ncbi:IclR family transcriptional regulator [Streptomyces sp. ActVer]|uniref:IclR family transcriptional regulator n=1 Tax=Streptomyces sp. ActVer TaxID=3014558 RepID=UPI0022B5D78C|nr:IclR family transcriptional regulator [Streptomyces sp. ActVer]MCZ4507614.1 IclR family transcriptional regulator [Streptomyces sp. ActVer]
MSPAERDGGAPPAGSLDRAAAILGAFDATHRDLTLAALVARSGLPRSTAHRTADRMIRLGWLDKPKDRYRIGNRLFEIASLAPIRLQLREAVLPFLQDLHSATKVTVQLGVLDGAQILVVEKITGHRPMPMLSQVGGIIPAHCSALGRAILAYSDTATIDAVLAAGLERRTPRTLTDPVAILRELTAIPPRGWAVEREEGNIGVSCVAAPVFDPLGEVVAALSVTGPSGLIRAQAIGTAVRLAAAAASRAYCSRR